jgi:AcrR family transcriptional regulator
MRRTQEERRAETQAKLLDATIESVLDVGYAATTTRRVAEMAGVSLGAQTHHYPRRVDLVGAAVERLAERRMEALREHAAGIPGTRAERLPAVLDMLWSDFSGPLFTVFVKLWVVAADDPELYARLVPVERRIARSITAAMQEFAGEQHRVEWEPYMLTVLSTMRGLALTQGFEPRAHRRRDPWPSVRKVLIEDVLSDA